MIALNCHIEIANYHFEIIKEISTMFFKTPFVLQILSAAVRNRENAWCVFVISITLRYA